MFLVSPKISECRPLVSQNDAIETISYRFWTRTVRLFWRALFAFRIGVSLRSVRPNGSRKRRRPIAPDDVVPFDPSFVFNLTGSAQYLTFCWRSKILRAERFHIAVAQAIERQPCQGEFLRERSKNRFPLCLIRFPRSDVVEAFSRLLVIF